MQQGIDDWQAVRDRVERLPHVVAVQANLHLMGMIQKPGGDSVSFVGVGVEPEREQRMGFETKVREGRSLAAATPAEGEGEVVLALGLAAALGRQAGRYPDPAGSQPGRHAERSRRRVAGLVTTGVQELDTRYLKLHLATGQRLLATDRVSNLLVGLDDTAATGSQPGRGRAGARRADAPPLAVTPWEKRAAFYSQVRNLYLGIFWFLGSIVFVLVVLATSNTLVMTVMERVREIGTLRAIGTAPGQIAAHGAVGGALARRARRAPGRRAGRRRHRRHQRRCISRCRRRRAPSTRSTCSSPSFRRRSRRSSQSWRSSS